MRLTFLKSLMHIEFLATRRKLYLSAGGYIESYFAKSRSIPTSMILFVQTMNVTYCSISGKCTTVRSSAIGCLEWDLELLMWILTGPVQKVHQEVSFQLRTTMAELLHPARIVKSAHMRIYKRNGGLSSTRRNDWHVISMGHVPTKIDSYGWVNMVSYRRHWFSENFTYNRTIIGRKCWARTDKTASYTSSDLCSCRMKKYRWRRFSCHVDVIPTTFIFVNYFRLFMYNAL